MTRRDKLVERIVRRPPDASFEDVRQVFVMYGWIYARTKGSHASFTKPGERTQVIPVHGGRVRRVYLDRVCEVLGLGDDEANDHGN